MALNDEDTIAQKGEIRWLSGLTQTLKDVPADDVLQVDEPARIDRNGETMNSCLASMRSLLSSVVVISLLFGVYGYAQLSGDFERGMAEFRAGHYSSAAALFANAKYAFPGATDALLYRAKSLVHLQDFSGTEQALDNYITSHHDSSDALYMLGFRSKP